MSSLGFMPCRSLPVVLDHGISLMARKTVVQGRNAVRMKRPNRSSVALMSNKSVSNSAENRHIVLLSGGVDSSTLLRLISAERDSHITGMFFDYGQRAVRQELRACQAQCEEAGISDFVQVDLRGVSSAFQRRVKERRHIPLHHRNVVLLSLGLSLAGQEDAKGISVAICKDDMSWYASASKKFLNAFREVGRALGDVEIEAPLEAMSKSEVVRKGEELGVEWSSTWSCMIGRSEVHCGRCRQCRSRKKAFEEAGVSEVEGFYMR